MGGDIDIVPIRMVQNEQSLIDIPCDQYFANLDGNWNANGNSIFAETYWLYDIDFADLEPEVFMGRTPVETAEEVNIFIYKTKSYANRISQTYQDRVLFVGNRIFGDGDGPAYCDYLADLLPPEIETDKIYHDGTGNITFNETNIKNALGDDVDDGYNMVYYTGHGYSYALTISSAEENGLVDRNEADGFDNENKYPIMFCCTCMNNALDFDSFVEHYMLNSNGGCVAFIGSANGDNPYFSTYYPADKFFDLIYNEDIRHLGEAFSISKQELTPWANSHGFLSDNVYGIKSLW